MIYVFDRVENIVETGENAGYQHFLLLSQCFQKPSCKKLLKVGVVWERLNLVLLVDVWYNINYPINQRSQNKTYPLDNH